ncbi:hypothetical protein A3K86_18655 [Photobacterium jeanii]|uniref:GTP-binding protein n=1 Tax=Photobacterium jeanii TaxID=858640 RepID=A0A178K0Z4_9GAMM|nr:hypothetical protein [Photobacterium jeanii]OAN10998.1 hypothetical protein A3K86_18655 [Photobacterium jeanii]PST90513.1 hypothetical protein C9I91_07755 [Photobacterium jeanii]
MLFANTGYKEKRLNTTIRSIFSSLILALTITSFSSFAEQRTTDNENERNAPLVHVNVSLELDEIEHSVANMGNSFESIAQSLDTIAHSDQLSAEQQETLAATVDNFNQLIVLSKDTLTQLPASLEHSKGVIEAKSQAFLNDLQLKILLIVSAVVVALVVILFCIYWFVLRPLLSTVGTATTNISAMAKSIQITAQALETSTQKQEQIMKQLDSKES